MISLLGMIVGGTMRSQKTKRLVLLSLFSTLIILFTLTPLGYIPIGVIRATTLHIPVILAGILLGKKEGSIIGFVFGLSSLLVNTFQPTPTSFVFSPFVTIGNTSGNLYSLLIVFVPRILLGWLSGFSYEVFKNKFKNKTILLGGIAAFNTILHTTLVLSAIMLFFKEPYAQAREVSVDLVFSLIMVTVATNGVIEAIIAAIATIAVAKLLLPTLKERH